MSEIRIQKTGEPDVIAASDGRLTLSIPIQIKRRSGRKLVTLPIDPVDGRTNQDQTLGHGHHAVAAGTGQRSPMAGDAGVG